MINTEELRNAMDAFERGELNAADYKKISGGYGTYMERGDKTHMLRLGLAGGEADARQLGFIAGCAEKYKAAFAHITTCQTIQLHHLSSEAVCGIIGGSDRAGIRTLGCGGDHPRNVMASPLSGVDPADHFDVMPYAKAAAGYLAEADKKIRLPRKLKVSFESSDKNDTHATFRDVGFIARPNGTFDVYTAGGLGVSPKLGLLTAENVDPGDTLLHLRAMIMTFIEHGNYKNRAKARTRFMRDEMGDERYKEEYHKNLQKAIDEGAGKLQIPRSLPDGPGQTENCPKDERIFCQKQAGRYAVRWIPVGGIVSIQMLRDLSSELMRCGEAVLRLVPGGGAYIINCTEKEAYKFLKITENDTAVYDIEKSTACIGCSVCRTGIRDSQKLLSDIVLAVKASGLPEKCLPPIRISGCPSSCGAHQSGTIGFQGRVKKTASGELKSAFAVFLDGSGEAYNERMGESLGVVLTEDIPDMMVEIGKNTSSSFFEKYDENIVAARDIIMRYV